MVVHDDAHDVTRPDGVASPLAKQRLHLRRHALRRHLCQRTHQRQRDRRDFALRRFIGKVAELGRQLAARFVRLHRTHAGHHGTALEQHRAGKRYPREGFRISSQFRSLESQSVVSTTKRRKNGNSRRHARLAHPLSCIALLFQTLVIAATTRHHLCKNLNSYSRAETGKFRQQRCRIHRGVTQESGAPRANAL
ncbi:hypothetical protein D9M68_688280 [compost metagenome]